MDWAVIIDTIIAIAGVLGLGGLATKLYYDGKRLREALIAAKASIMKMWAEIVAANEDKDVTQEEFTKIVAAASVFMKDFDEIVNSGTIVVEDLYALKDAIEALLKTWGATKAAAAKK